MSKNYVKKHESGSASNRMYAKCEDIINPKSGALRGHKWEPVSMSHGEKGYGGNFRCRRCGHLQTMKAKDKHGDKINTRRHTRG